MILTNLKHSARISSLHPRLEQLFDYLNTHNLLKEPLGRIEIDGDNLFINNIEAAGLLAGSQALEIHREYIDVHIPLKSKEIIGWKLTDDVKEFSQEYDPQSDSALSAELATTYIEMNVGEIMILYPEDAHAPLIGEGLIRKAIAKIKL